MMPLLTKIFANAKFKETVSRLFFKYYEFI